MPDTYRRALDAACRDYERALADRASIEDRIAQLRQTIGTLTRLCGLAPTVTFGLADACRMVLRNARTPVTPTAVRDRLAAIGVDLDRYANPLAAIHTTLKRLAEAGEVQVERTEEPGRVAYRFEPMPRSAASMRAARSRPRSRSTGRA